MKMLLGLVLMLAVCAAVANANCEDTRCPRFYNAKCMDSHCSSNSSCSPHFFFRGRNVTEKCDARICSRRRCPERRHCVEEVIPTMCPTDRQMCRQYLKSKCVLPPYNRSMSCNESKCGPGEVCRFRERPGLAPVVRCVSMEKQTSCINIHCGDGLTCMEEGSTITCISDSTTTEITTTTMEDQTSQATPPVLIGSGGMLTSGSGHHEESCMNFECPRGQHCIMSSILDFIGCIPDHLNNTCAELSCPLEEALICNRETYPTFRNCSIASCITEEEAEQYKKSRLTSNSCEKQREVCLRNGLTCVDLCQGNNIPIGIDCTLFNCRENLCPDKHKCDDIPEGLAGMLLSHSICIPDNIDIAFDTMCTSDQAQQCSPGSTCTEYKIGDIVVGSYCDHGVIPHLPCSERTCSEEGEVCRENSFQSVELHSLCTNTNAVLHKLASLGQESCIVNAMENGKDMK